MVLSASQQITSEPSGQESGKWNQLKQQSQEAPAELRAAIEEASYRLERDKTVTGETGYLMPNTAQGWRARFDSDSLSMETCAAAGRGAQHWALHLESYGYGEKAKLVECAEVVAAGHRVEYRRGSLVEWYVNERRGVEQGFTISEPPAVAGERAQGEPLSLRLVVEGDLRAELSADGQSVGFMDAAGQRELLYDTLMAFDARGHELPSRMKVEGREVVLEVEDAGASYPLTVDPLIQQQKLMASDAAAGDLFGHSVSLSGDTAIVGAYSDDNAGGGDAGAAYVFTRSGSVWTLQQKLTASDAAAGDGFGFSVSVSGDTAVIGSINDKNSSGQAAGSAYVFTRSSGVWTQQQRLQASDVALNDQFGYSVSLSDDTAVIGSDGDDDGGDLAGSAYVFTRSGGVWTQQQKLTASGGAARSNFGLSVELSGDTVIIGAWQESNAGGSAAGAAYVFTRSGGVWTQQQKLTASDAHAQAFFGTSVSLSGDTAIVGASLNNALGHDAGAAYVFTRSGGVWTQQQKLTALDAAADDLFGHRVSVRGDTAVISAPLDNNGGIVDAGSAYIFTRTGGVWTQQQKFQASDAAADDSLGISVSLSGDTVLIGAYQDDNSGGVDAGSAYVFVLGVTNAAPVVNAGPDQPATENVAFNLTASFTDADASDTHTATVNWGDGSPTEAATVTEPSGSNPGTVTVSHTYLAPGNYAVMVTVTDGANASGSDTLQVMIGSTLSASYIQNTMTQQANANFNISGNGVVAGNLSVNGTLNASGSSLTNLNAANITTGTLDNARLGAISTTNIADSAITAPKIADSTVTAAKIGSNQVVKNLNGLTDNVNLTAGANVTITPSGNTLMISAAGGNFIQNTTTQQASSNFNISGNGTAGGILSGSIVNATTQFNLSGNRILSAAGTDNLFAGNTAGNSNTTGSANSFFGTNAGLSNTTGSNNTTIGSSADVGTNNLSFATAIGSNAVVNTSNTIVLGRSTGQDTVQIPGNLNVTGTISGNVSGASLTNLNANNITSGTLADARLSPNIATLSGIQTFIGATTFAGGISGNGSGLTGLNASNITNGILDNARLGVVGVANGGTGLTSAGTSGNFLRSNGTSFTSSALTTTDIPDLSANYIRNQTGTAQSGGFNISGNGTAVNFTASSTLSGSIVNATMQFNIGGNRVLSVAGASNIFAGNGAGNSNTTGSQNSFVGANAGLSNTTGDANSFFGAYAGQNNTTGYRNSFLGRQAGQNNTTGIQNSFVGTYAGVANTEGHSNSFAGYAAGYSNTTGVTNSFFGTFAGYNNTLGNSNVFVGVSAGQSNTTGNYNSFFGTSAGYSNASGNSNVFVGINAGYSTTSGSFNSILGTNAGYNNTTGYNNSFVGVSAGQSNTTGYNNAFFGAQAGYTNTTGINNSFFGTAAGYNTTGAQNAFVGTSAGQSNTTGSDNSFVGMNAGYSNTTGSQNVSFGRSAGFYSTTGNYNVFLGMSAGLGNTTGTSNTLIGALANVGSNNLSYATAIGAEATVGTSNTIVLGRSAAQDTVLTPGLFQLNTLGAAGSTQLCRNASNQISTCSSSLRYKTNIGPFTFGLNLVQRLHPITFTWKNGGMKDLGFGAEDVAAINPLFVTYNAKGEVEGVKYDRLSVIFVNAFKEQQTQIEMQQTQLKQQQTQLDAQQQQLKQQQAQIDGLKKLLCQQNPKADVCQ